MRKIFVFLNYIIHVISNILLSITGEKGLRVVDESNRIQHKSDRLSSSGKSFSSANVNALV